jgi:hypothetical protein
VRRDLSDFLGRGTSWFSAHRAREEGLCPPDGPAWGRESGRGEVEYFAPAQYTDKPAESVGILLSPFSSNSNSNSALPISSASSTLPLLRSYTPSTPASRSTEETTSARTSTLGLLSSYPARIQNNNSSLLSTITSTNASLHRTSTRRFPSRNTLTVVLLPLKPSPVYHRKSDA